MAVALIVEMTLKPGMGEAFVKRLRQHAAHCLAQEPGCLRFDALVPQEGADLAFIYEVYADAAALEAHWASAHMQVYRADVAEMVADRRVSRCNVMAD